jgi:hypothetical protein
LRHQQAGRGDVSNLVRLVDSDEIAASREAVDTHPTVDRDPVHVLLDNDHVDGQLQ